MIKDSFRQACFRRLLEFYGHLKELTKEIPCHGYVCLIITPLISRLQDLQPEVKQVWFADDATAAGHLKALYQWWTHLSSVGPQIGQMRIRPTLLLNLSLRINDAKRIFSNTYINITSQGQRHLGAAIVTRPFAKEYVSQKVQKWVGEICALADLAHTQPQAA